MLNRRDLMKTTAALGAATLVSSPFVRRAAAASKSPAIGYIADYPGGSLFAIAQDQKLWEAEGLTPDLKVFTNGPIQIQAMGANSLQFGSIGPGALWLPASGKTKVIAVNVVSFSDRVISQAPFKTMADLKGKKVGTPQGGSGEMILRLGLEKAGMSIKDIEMIPMDPSTVITAFTSKQIDAAGIWYPHVGTIKARVPDLNELVSNKDFYPDTSFINPFIAGNDVVANDPDLVKSYLRVLKRAMDYRVANLDRSIELTAAFLNAPEAALEPVAKSLKLLKSEELVGLTKDGTVDKWIDKLNGLFKAFGTVPDPLPASEVYKSDLFVNA